VLVTGADGFIGSHLAEQLLKAGAEVSIFVRGTSFTGTTRNFLKNLNSVKSELKNIVAGDIGGDDAVDLIRKNNPEVIFHLAAAAYVPYSFDHPREVYNINLTGTQNVLDAARGIDGLEQLVCTASSEIYGTCQSPIDETHRMNPTSPYASSKAAADRLAFSYFNTYHLPISIIRPFNTYGPRLIYDVIPEFIRRALLGMPLLVYGDGEQTRDFTYVEDMVRAFIFMGNDKKAVGEAVNFGSGHDFKIIDIAKTVVRLTGSKSEIKFVEKRMAEVEKLLCNYGKAKNLFGWEPAIGIEEGIKRTIEGIKNNNWMLQL
jgi:nucleoside-diphosphate-sugar epimerase